MADLGLDLAYEDDAPGFDSATGAAPTPPGGRAGPPADTVHAPLAGAALLARFTAQRERWFAGLQAETEGIARLLTAEAALSARLGGLPGTDHRSHWSAGVEDSQPQRRDHHAEWQPPLWVMTPLVRRQGGMLQLRLPPVLDAEDLLRALVAHCPPAWRRARVRVRLEVETRIYWGARAPSDGQPWQLASERGDGVGVAEALLEIDRGTPRWLLPPGEAASPVVRRSLRAGVGLMVAVPVIHYERLPKPLTLLGRVVQWLDDRWERLQGVHRDRDPTFVDRLQADEAWWAGALGARPRTPRELKQAGQHGALLAPASLPATTPAGEALHVVLVHGGLSSARAGFEAWLSEATPARPLWPGMPLFERLPVWRFEHDSFLSLDANMAALMEALQQQVVGRRPRGRLVLIAHSRGGAVVRFVLPELRDRWPGWDFHGLTAGGPHAGTDVFTRLGRRWVGLSGVVGVLGRVVGDAEGRAQLAKLKNIERGMAGDIPTGFQDVLSENIRERAAGQAWPAQLVTWGSEWRPGIANDWSARGWRHVIEDFGGFEADGDGMVPLASARHGPQSYDASPVFHTEYFAHPPTAAQMRAELERLAALP